MSASSMRIMARDEWDSQKDYDTALREDNNDEVRALLVGRRVEKVADDHLSLDDGTLLKLIGHRGGCACSAGDYDLTVLNGVDNVITAVEFVDEPGGDDAPCHTCGVRGCYTTGHNYAADGYYSIFVYADNAKINLATFEGSDGNGYYGTGYTILVRKGGRA